MVSSDGKGLRAGSGAGLFDADSYPSTLNATVYAKQ